VYDQEKKSPNGWTLDTLERHISTRLGDIKKLADEREEHNKERADSNYKAIGAALDSVYKTLEKIEKATEKRFDAVNEFRQALQDQTNSYMPRAELVVQLQGILDRFEAINNLVSAATARISSIESSLRTKQEGTIHLGTIISISIAALAAGGTIGGLIFGLIK
jgi:hypothetical protein